MVVDVSLLSSARYWEKNASRLSLVDDALVSLKVFSKSIGQPCQLPDQILRPICDLQQGALPQTLDFSLSIFLVCQSDHSKFRNRRSRKFWLSNSSLLPQRSRPL